MPEPFTLEDQIHHADDPQCAGCVEDYPEPCSCGGLMHASEVIADEDVEIALATQCDRCRRSEGDLEEEVA
jgi:hypothetical protein